MSAALSHTAEISRPGTLEHLPALLAFLDAAAAEAGVGDDVLFPIHLAAEEACANVIMHGYAGGAPGPLSLRLDTSPDTVAVTIADQAPPFDPAQAPAPALDADAASRSIGGLGWHFIHEMMDEVRHEALPAGGNRLTLVKHRPPSPSPPP